MTHNLKPEVVPLIIEVLKEHQQTSRRLARIEDGQMCFCFEGAVCEAYRRAHPNEAKWIEDASGNPVLSLFDGDQHCSHSTVGRIDKWATADGKPATFDGKPATSLNDSQLDHWDFARFIKELSK